MHYNFSNLKKLEIMKFKTYKYIAGILLSGGFFAACDSLNEPISFKNSDSFVAFNGENMAVSESENGNVMEVKIPVMVVTAGPRSGITVEYELDAQSTAKENVDFKIMNESRTIDFKEGFGTEYIVIQTVNDDSFTGTREIKFNLKANNANLNWGAEKSFTVSIKDDDHPYGWLLGKYTLSGIEIRAGQGEWPAEISAVDGDITLFDVVGLASVGPYAAPFNNTTAVKAKLDPETMTLKFQTGQMMTSWGYGPVRLDGMYGPAGSTEIKEGDFITSEVVKDGSKITINFKDVYVFYITEGNNAGLYIGGLDSDGESVPTKLVKK